MPVYDSPESDIPHVHRVAPAEAPVVVFGGPAAWMVRGGYLTPQEVTSATSS